MLRPFLACAVAIAVASLGLLARRLPLPRADLDLPACLSGRDIPAAMWGFLLGAAVLSLAASALLARWAIPQVISGRVGTALLLVALLGTAVGTWSALWIGTLPYDCGSPIPVLDPLIPLVPTALATATGITGRHRFVPVLTAGLLVAAPVTLVLSLGWALYSPADVSFSVVTSAVGVLLGLTPALGAFGEVRSTHLDSASSEPH